MILERPEEPGKKYALALTVLVHVLLLAFLFFGVQWKRSKPEVYEVELWSPTPRPAQVVIPPPPPPEPVVKPQPKPEPKPEPKVEPPPPKKPDIAIKEEKKKPEPPKPESKKPEPPKPEPKKPEPPKPEVKPQPKFDFSKELASETSQLKSSAKTAATAQQMANAAAAEAEQRASSNKRGKADYANKIRGKIRGNIILPPSIQGNPEAVFMVEQLPTGEVLSVKLKRSSGNGVLDRAIETAILKSSPLPKPDDPSLFERSLEIKYRPFEE
ncbi:MAG: TonB C-terminal domain-containing protein [Betaproteobacteria bacterium]|nr:TonB C-terminal domain-containing protein [Betaproteobacteria bacterium]